MTQPIGPTFEITLKLGHNDEFRTTTVSCNEILNHISAPFVGEQIGEIFAQALMHLFPGPTGYDVRNIRACVDAMSSAVYETYEEPFEQFPEKE
jgi:hypothetical protein